MPFSVPFSPVTVPLEHSQLGTQSASLRPATLADADTWELTWRPLLVAKQREDGLWLWREHIQLAEEAQDALCLAVEAKGALEALLSLRLQKAASRLAKGEDILYVEYVGVAPWNQPPPVGQQTYKGLGRLLLFTSGLLSLELGLLGRLGLHAKPDVEGFYQRLGLTPVGHETLPDGTWLYFEAEPAWAGALKGRKP